LEDGNKRPAIVARTRKKKVKVSIVIKMEKVIILGEFYRNKISLTYEISSSCFFIILAKLIII